MDIALHCWVTALAKALRQSGLSGMSQALTKIGVIFAPATSTYRGSPQLSLRSEDVGPEDDFVVNAHAIWVFPALSVRIPSADNRLIKVPEQ